MLKLPDLTNLDIIKTKVEPNKITNIHNLCKMKGVKFIVNSKDLSKCFNIEYHDKKDKQIKTVSYDTLDNVINYLNNF